MHFLGRVKIGEYCLNFFYARHLHLSLGDLEKCEEYYLKAFELRSKKCVRVCLGLCEMFIGKKEWEKAGLWLEKGKGICGDCGIVQKNYGRLRRLIDENI